jgi:hypothetical protein
VVGGKGEKRGGRSRNPGHPKDFRPYLSVA